MKINLLGEGSFKLNFKVLSLIFILFLIISLIGVSFSYWRFGSIQNDKNIASSKCFKVNITNESDAITLTNMHPISDEEGLKSSSYSFTIENTCDTYAMYQVNLEDILDDTITKRLNNKYIKISLNDGTPKVLNTYQSVTPTINNADASFKLTSGSLSPKGSNNDSVNYNLKLWMDYDTPAIDEVMSATFKSKISVVSVYTEEENLNNEITIAYTSKDIEYSNVSETVEITGESKEKDIIEYSEDGSSYTSVDIPSKKVTLLRTYNKEITPHIYFKDEVGNIKEKAIELKYLDQTGPTISLNKSSEWGIANTIDITLKDEKSGLNGYALTNTETEPSEWTHVNGQEVNTTETVYNNGKYYIYAKDSLGNISHTSIDIDKIDDIAPVITNITEQSEYGLTSKITINAKDNETGLTGYSITSTNEEPTTWTDINNVTEESSYTYEASTNGLYYVWIKDGANHIVSKSFNVTKVDTEGPTTPVITNNYNDIWTNNDVTVTLTSDDDKSGIDHFEWYEGNAWTTRALTTNGNTGTITYTVTRNETIRFRAVDKLGNISEEATTIVKVDKEPPTLTSITNSSNGNWSTSDIKITLNGTDNQSGVLKYQIKYSSNSNTWTDLSSNSNTDTWSAQRNETVYYRVVDNVGNASSEKSTVIKLDKTNPTAKISASVSNNTITISASGSSDTNSGIKKYEYSKDNKTYYSSTTTTYNFTGLNDGAYTLYLRVTDNAGRSTTVSTSAVVAYQNVYVSSSGNDSSGNGSSSKPYASIAKAYTKVKSGGQVILLSNLTQTSQANFNTSGKSVTLKSNGSSIYTITRGSGLTTGSIINFYNSSTTTVTNIKFNGNNVSASKPLLISSNSATVNLNSGVTIQNALNTATSSAGGFSVHSSSTLNINGATITSNKSNNQGAGVYVSGASLNFNSGTISNNSFTTSNGSGAGILGWQATVNIKGGTISGNTATAEGGGIWVGGNSGKMTFNMTAGTITGNKANGSGGGILIANDSNVANTKATISGGTIKSNKTDVVGGGIATRRSTINYGNAQVTNNTATSGGGIAVWLNSNFTINSGTIQSNTATSTGGGIVVNSSTLTINNGNITNNISSDLGGGIAAWNSAKIYFKGGYVQNNTSANNGGGITFGNPGTALYMQGGSVINNRSNAANTYGGLYWGQNATYSYSSGTISGNTPINSNV